MPKSKSKNEPVCKNCFLCEKVRQVYHNYNISDDISTLLAKVTQWDINNRTQFKQIQKFECLVCHFETSIFNDWKCHIMSLSHLSDCHSIKNVYSYVCCNAKCKVLLYGTEKSLLIHQKNHTNKQNDTVCLPGIPTLMVEVMKRFGIEENPLYFCSHCKRFANKSIHEGDEKISKGLKNPIKIYCKFCRVKFFSSPEMIDVHSLSVEHLTLKCLDQLYCVARSNSKKIKLSEPKFDQSSPSKENNYLQSIENVCVDNSMKLPMVILNRFKNVSLQDENKLCKCKVCNVLVIWEGNEIVSHLFKCNYKIDLTGSNETSMNTFECNVCNFSTNCVLRHKKHMVSYLHLSNCHDTYNLYSYFCNECKIFMYSYEVVIKDHWKLHLNDNIMSEIPILSTFMANIFKDFNRNPNRENIIHYYGKNESNEFSKIVSIPCRHCKIEFHTSVVDYNRHEITSEHIILKLLTSNMSGTNGCSLRNSLTTKSKIVVTNPVVNKSIQDVPLLPNYDHPEIAVNKHLKTAYVNKSQANLDKNHTELSNSIQKDQTILVSNVSMKNLEHYTKQELTPSHGSKSQYTKYFIHKMKFLNVLHHYKDRIINTKSYYCDVCDFMVEDKIIWDNHNQTKHQDCNESEIYCSTCSMFIIGPNSKEHYNTIEHCLLLQFFDSLQLVESNLIENAALVNSVVNNTLNEIPINIETFEELKSRESSEEVLESQCVDDNGCKINDFTLHRVKDDCKNNSDKMTSLMSLSDNDQKNSPNMTKLINDDILTPITKNNSLSDSINTKHCCSKDVDVTIQNKCNSKDVSTSTEDLIFHNLKVNKVIYEVALENNINEPKNEVLPTIVSLGSSLPDVGRLHKYVNTVEFHEDNAYGEYVAQRLKHIENPTVKQDIKLQIDHLFYIKMKQPS